MDKDVYNNSVAINGIPDAQNQLYVGGTIKTTGKITAPSMSVTDISSQYSFTKSSGAWNFNSVEAYRSGNVVQMRFSFKGTGTKVTAGSNGLVGTLSGGPLPIQSVLLAGFDTSSIVMGYLNNSGNLTIRLLIDDRTWSGVVYMTATFIVND